MKKNSRLKAAKKIKKHYAQPCSVICPFWNRKANLAPATVFCDSVHLGLSHIAGIHTKKNLYLNQKFISSEV